MFMRAPRGFGKRYFSLTAILAYAVAPRLSAERSRFSVVRNFSFDDEEQEEEDPPPIAESELCVLSQPSSSHPCHCNCFFRKRTLLLLKLVRHLAKCNCKCRFFSFRRTGTHPPRLSFFLSPHYSKNIL